MADNIILDLNREKGILGIEIVGSRPEDLKGFKPKARIVGRTS